MSADAWPWTVVSYPWCRVCGRTATANYGDACGGCMGTLEAMLDPIVRPANPPRLGRLAKLRQWVGRLG